MRADRLLSIMMLLRARGKLTTSWLAESLEVSRRTILRDVDALSVAGVPIYTEVGRGGGVWLDENYRVSLTGLNEQEIYAMFVATGAGPLGDLGLGRATESTLLKLFASLPSLHRDAVEHFRQRVYIDPTWWWHEAMPEEPYLADLQRAVYEDRVIEASYETREGESAPRLLEPFSLVAKAGIWYLVARRDGELRVYRVSRLREVVVLEQRFSRPPDFDLSAFWQARSAEFSAQLTPYAFTVRVHESARQFVRWYGPTRRQSLAQDGDWTTIRFEAESEEAARMFVFGLGTGARVLEPESLRASLRIQVQSLAAALSDGDDTSGQPSGIG